MGQSRREAYLGCLKSSLGSTRLPQIVSRPRRKGCEKTNSPSGSYLTGKCSGKIPKEVLGVDAVSVVEN